jgi:uncharacterized membrane protein (DUF485 family)
MMRADTYLNFIANSSFDRGLRLQKNLIKHRQHVAMLISLMILSVIIYYILLPVYFTYLSDIVLPHTT